MPVMTRSRQRPKLAWQLAAVAISVSVLVTYIFAVQPFITRKIREHKWVGTSPLSLHHAGVYSGALQVLSTCLQPLGT